MSFVQGVHQDPNAGRRTGNLAAWLAFLDSIRDGHLEIQNNEIRLQLFRLRHGFTVICSFPVNLPMRMRFDYTALIAIRMDSRSSAIRILATKASDFVAA